jgi:hypothetical protein
MEGLKGEHREMEANVKYPLDASSTGLALHGIFHQLSDPLFELFLMHSSFIIKELGVRY